MHHHFLFLKHKEEGDDISCCRLFRCNRSKKKKAMLTTIVALFVATKPKKEGDGNLLPSLCSLQQNQKGFVHCNRKKEKGNDNSCHCLFCYNITKREGRELTLKLPLWPISFGSHFKHS
jgi:hypothetical protein